MTTPVYIDATMIYRWRELAPVGIVRLERMLANHLRFHAALPAASYLIWDSGYRHATDVEATILDRVVSGTVELDGARDLEGYSTPLAARTRPNRRLTFVAAVRRTALKTVGRLPPHLQPFAEQAAWSAATLGVETARHARRNRPLKDAQPCKPPSREVRHQVDFSDGADLVAVGLGWEYIEHEAMYNLKVDDGVRIHMPAFDLIPVLMPQMNAGQSHLVHRYYAEMAHYADTITSISEATATALNDFYLLEGLVSPLIETNPLPAFDIPDSSTDGSVRPHQFEGEDFVLTVSTIEVRKNHLLLAKVWAECIAEGHDLPRLVLVGRVGWDVNELMQWAFHAPELDDRFTIMSDVDDGQLAALYRDAIFTVFPSRIEGWGLPITEALSLGKVCVHSDDPAQLEASQGLMPTLHPDDFLGWKAQILELVADRMRVTELERTLADQFVRRTPNEYCERFESIIAARRDGQT